MLESIIIKNKKGFVIMKKFILLSCVLFLTACSTENYRNVTLSNSIAICHGFYVSASNYNIDYVDKNNSKTFQKYFDAMIGHLLDKGLTESEILLNLKMATESGKNTIVNNDTNVIKMIDDACTKLKYDIMKM